MAKGYYAVLRGRQPGVYRRFMQAQAQVLRFSDAFLRGFDTREEAEAWLAGASGQRYPYYDAQSSVTPTHRISPSCRPPEHTDPDGLYTYLLRSDGASRGNPGQSGCGGLIWRLPHPSADDVPVIARYKRYLGHTTNNEAEYAGLARGLALARGLGIRYLQITVDSELVAKQCNGVWQASDPRMAFRRDVVQALLHQFDWWKLTAVTREYNHAADRAANEAVDEGVAGTSVGEVRIAVYNFEHADLPVGESECSERVAAKFRQCGMAPISILTEYHW